jgi:TRAP-type uncharacterized transport system substrate-binding protein
MKILSTVFALMLATSAVAQDNLVIAGGLGGGGYNRFALDLSERLEQRGYRGVSVTQNNGSDAITLAACSGSADIWIAQVDAIYKRYTENCELRPVGIYGNEYAVLLVPPESEISELADMDENTRIAVDGIGSGSELFWKTIVSIENGDDGDKDDWASAQAVNSASDMLLTMQSFGDIDAVLLVRKPDSPDVENLLERGWELAQLWDRDIDDLQFNSVPLYASEERYIGVNKYSGNNYNWVYEVRSFIGVSEEHAGNQQLIRDLASAVQ